MKQAAGILVYKKSAGSWQVLLVHLGGPLWSRKDMWSIPKGELEDGEDHLVAAKREFEEELGSPVPGGELLELGNAKHSGKTNYVWAVEGDFDISTFKSNNFTMEWPPRSGRQQEFPENDRAQWFDLTTAKQKLFDYQGVFIDRLADALQVAVLAQPEQQQLL